MCRIIQLFRPEPKSETLATLARAGLRAREAREKPRLPSQGAGRTGPLGLKPCGLRRASLDQLPEIIAATVHGQPAFRRPAQDLGQVCQQMGAGLPVN